MRPQLNKRANYALSAGKLSAKGAILPLGPDPSKYANTSYTLEAQRFNTYRAHSVNVQLTPLQNQTKAQGQVYMWVTNDAAATLPTDDIAIMNQCQASGGVNIFSGYPKSHTLQIPVSTDLSYSTGQGDASAGGTAFKNQANLMLAVVGGGTDDLVTVQLTINTTFSGPGIVTAKAVSTPAPVDPFAPNEWLSTANFTSTGTNLTKIWSGLKEVKALLVMFSSDHIDAYPTEGNVGVATDPPTTSITYYYIAFPVVALDTIANPPNASVPTENRSLYTWNATNKAWEKAKADYSLPAVRISGPAQVTVASPSTYLEEFLSIMQITDNDGTRLLTVPVEQSETVVDDDGLKHVQSRIPLPTYLAVPSSEQNLAHPQNPTQKVTVTDEGAHALNPLPVEVPSSTPLPVAIHDKDGTYPNKNPILTDEYTTTAEDLAEGFSLLTDLIPLF